MGLDRRSNVKNVYWLGAMYVPAMTLEPMLAAAGRKVFDDPDWSFELKYAGFRALYFLDESGSRFISERGSNLMKRLPDLGQVRDALKARSVVLDGVIVAGDGSVKSFKTLFHRYAKFGITQLKPKEMVAVKYLAFDVLLLNGRSLLGETLKNRQAHLRKLIPRSSGRLLRAKTVIGRGNELFDEAESDNFKGIVAKRLDSIYEPGKRSKSWLKIRSKLAP